VQELEAELARVKAKEREKEEKVEEFNKIYGHYLYIK